MKVTIKLNNGHEIRIEKDYLTPNRLRELIRKEYSKHLDDFAKNAVPESRQQSFKRADS